MFALLNPATSQSLICSAINFTELKSPSDAIGNPASITSTPNFSSCNATLTFSSSFILQPGACSPSLSVVSKIFTKLPIELEI